MGRIGTAVAARSRHQSTLRISCSREAVLERDVERSCELLATHYRRTLRAVTQILLVPEPAKGG